MDIMEIINQYAIIPVAVACFLKTMLVDLKLVFTLETIEVAAIVSATMF